MASGMKVWVEIPSGLEASEDAVDIVAIHGIGADPDTTWGGRDSKGQRLNWLKDANMLPEAVPAARIMRFGYQSAWVDSATERGKTTFVSDIARMLLSDLASHRHNITRPIIFLAHSYGGLVLIQALRASHDDPDRWENVFAYSAGLVFFGTPFRGRSGLTVSEMVKAIMENNKSSNIFSETMKLSAADNPHLRDIFSRFTEIRRRDNPIPVWCFYEALPSPISKVLENEKVKNGYLVTEESACLDISKGVERYPLERHHYNLQKFSGPHDPEYRPVKEAIQQLARGAREFLAPQAFDPAFKAALDEFLDQIHVTDPHLDKQRIQNAKGGLLADSFVWILRHERFTTFLNNTQDHQLLWIKGDPGKGKTMLLCGIVDHLKEISKKQPCFFFCQAADERLNNAVAVIRSLIYLLLRQCPSLYSSHVKDKYNYGQSGFFKNVNTWFALSGIFLSMLNDPAARDAILIVDALDECTTQREELLKLITQASGVRWIVASRGWPVIREHLSGRLMIELELEKTFISEAVKLFIDHRVQQLAKKRRYSPERKEAVAKHLHANADDTFLWVALVCQELEKRPHWHAEKSWETLPPGLNGLYERMLDQIGTQSDPELCRDILATISLAKRPLTIAELSVLLLPREGLDLEDLHEMIDSCGSFLTMTRRDDTGYVHYVHQSATDYILGDGAGRVFSTTESDHHHVLFSRSMTALSSNLRKNIYRLESLGSFIREVRVPKPDPLAPIRYSCVHWMDHLSEVRLDDGEKKALQNSTILDEFLRTKFLFWLEALSLLRDLTKGVSALSSLQGLVGLPVQNADMAEFPNLLYDAVRFIRHSLQTMKRYPLQVYVSALVFAPTKSIVRNLYKHNQPSWMTMQPRMDQNWSACFQTFEGSTRTVSSVAWSPDGKWIASADYGGLIKLWDPMTGALLRSLRGHNNGVSSVAFSPVDSSRLASSGGDGKVKLWDLTDGKCLQTFHFPANTRWLELKAVAFSPDGQRLAGACHYGTAIWELQTMKHVYTLESMDHYDVAFSPDNQFIATSGNRGLKLWDASTGTFLRTFDSDAQKVWAVAFSINGKRLAWGDIDGRIDVWDVDSWTCLYTTQEQDKRIWAIAFSMDDQRLAVAFGDGLVRVYNAETGSQIQTLRGHSGVVISIVVSPDDSRQLASASNDGTVKIWHLDYNSQSSVVLQEYDESEEVERPVGSITLSKDGTRLLSMTTTRYGQELVACMIWDTSTGKCLQKLREMHESTTPSSDGQWLAAVEHGSPSVQIWDLTAMRCIRVLGHGSSITCLAFSNDSQRLAVGTDGGIIKIWHVRQGICLQVLVNHFSPMDDSEWSVSFSPDGQRLASSDGRYIVIWDLDNGRCVKRNKPDNLRGLFDISSWSADGQQVVVCSDCAVSVLPTNENYPGTLDLTVYQEDSELVTMTADNRWIAAVIFSELRVSNVETGQRAWHKKTSYKISKLSFDPTCNSRLFTNMGVIEFELPSTLTRHGSSAEPLRLHRIGYGISFDGQWIMRGDERMLKLPMGYHARSVDVTRTQAGLEYVVAIHCKIDRLIFMRFK